ncbi:MAG TPA: hypothetical protein VHE79_06455 [Spirochaetia bacterium]
MFGFLVKKAFFDMWDNMFRIIIMNLGYIAVLAIFFLLAPLFISIPALFIATIGVGIAVFAVYTGGVSRMCSEIADYKQPGFADFFSYVREALPSSLLLALVVAVYALVVSVAFRFYGGMKTIVGPLAVALLFWVTVAWAFASQFFFPIQSRLDRKFRKIFRKTFLVFFDNPGFSIGLFFCTLLILGISVFTALLLPGLASILLWWNVAFKLRLYKYDWLEQNPSANRRHVPWDALLVDDRERVGKRTFKGMIFPWKE